MLYWLSTYLPRSIDTAPGAAGQMGGTYLYVSGLRGPDQGSAKVWRDVAKILIRPVGIVVLNTMEIGLILWRVCTHRGH